MVGFSGFAFADLLSGPRGGGKGREEGEEKEEGKEKEGKEKEGKKERRAKKRAKKEGKGKEKTQKLSPLTVKQPHEPSPLLDRVRLHQLLPGPLVSMLGSGDIPQHPFSVEGPTVIGADDAGMALGALDRIRDPALVERGAAVRAHVRDRLHPPFVPRVAEQGQATPQRRDSQRLSVVSDLLAQRDRVPEVLQVGAAPSELLGAAAQDVGRVERARGEAGAPAAVGERRGRRRRRGGVVIFCSFPVGVVAAAPRLPLSREKGLGLLLLQRGRGGQQRGGPFSAGHLYGPRDGRGGRSLRLRRGLEHGRRGGERGPGGLGCCFR